MLRRENAELKRQLESCQRDLFSGLTNEDVEREKVRGIFVIGAIAVLFYIRQISNGPVTLGLPPYVVTFDDIMKTLAMYVVAVAIALLFPKDRRDSGLGRIYTYLAKTAYRGAYLFYFLAIMFLLGVLALQYYQMILSLAIFIALVIVVKIIWRIIARLRSRITQA